MVRIQQMFVVMFILFTIAILAQEDHDHDHDYDHFTSTDLEDHHHDDMGENILPAFLITAFAGFTAFIGALSIFCIKKDSVSIIPATLAFSAGVTIYLSFVNLIPESVTEFQRATGDETGVKSNIYTLLCVAGGLLFTFGMEMLFARLGVDPHDHSLQHARHSRTSETSTSNTESLNIATIELNPPDSDTDDENHENTKLALPGPEANNLSHISYSVAFALILHHFPEGIATFVSLYHDLEFGLLVALALALHDIPSGVCIAVPTYLTTGSKTKPFLLCLIAAITYPIGALVGWVIIQTSTEAVVDLFVATLFAIIGGVMLYISFVELLPTAIIAANGLHVSNGKILNENRKGLSIALLFVGFLVMAVSNIALKAVGGHSH